MFFAAIAVAVIGAAPAEFSTHTLARRFATCGDAAAFALAHPTVGTYEYRVSARVSHASIRHVPALGYRGNARILYSFVPGSRIMVLPQWSWPQMTQMQNARLSGFVNAVRNHEIGHAKIAERGIAGRQSDIMVLSNSPQGVKERLAAVLASQVRALYDEVLETQKTYDRVTAHGMHQGEGPRFGFHGGEDIVFRCT